MKLIGVVRLGRDAELRHTASGDAVASFSAAFEYGRKGADGKRPSQWVDISMFGKRAESLCQYLTKGSQVMVYGGSPHIETFEKRDGTSGVKLSCIADDIELVGGRGESAPARPAAPAQRPQQRSQSAADIDDDIPF
jgi:single-strand DNA-binding protein